MSNRPTLPPKAGYIEKDGEYVKIQTETDEELSTTNEQLTTTNEQLSSLSQEFTNKSQTDYLFQQAILAYVEDL